MKRYIIAIVLLILLASSAWSFDGVRKGFVIGGGLGYALDAKKEIDGAAFITESNSGLGIILSVGYAWNEFNTIVYESNRVKYESKVSNKDVTQGFYGVSWYHYYSKVGSTIFTVVGLGTYAFEGEDNPPNDNEFGYLIGIGYEFSRHWQVGAYFSSGKTSDSNFDYNHNHLNIIVNGIAF